MYCSQLNKSIYTSDLNINLVLSHCWHRSVDSYADIIIQVILFALGIIIGKHSHSFK